MTPPVVSYAFAILGEQRAPWRATLDEVLCDALDADCAREEDEGIAVIVPGDILRTGKPVVTEARALRSRRQPAGSAIAGVRIERIIARHRRRR